MNKQGILVVVSGFSGAGKGTLMKALLSRYSNYALSVSATTRQPREGEQDGREYFFVTTEQFEDMIRKEQLVEYAKYVNHYYGTPKQYVMDQMAAGKDVVLEIEIQGALKVKEQFPEALLIFVVPPSGEELKKRLTDRGTESSDVIQARLHRASEEAEGMDVYDYMLVNDDLETAVEQMHWLIQSQHCRTNQNLEFIKKIKEELKQF